MPWGVGALGQTLSVSALRFLQNTHGVADDGSLCIARGGTQRLVE